MLKLLDDNEMQATDASCAARIPPPSFDNHGCLGVGDCYPFGWRNQTAEMMTFNAKWYHGGLSGKMFRDDALYQDVDFAITPRVAGMFAVCYCEALCDSAVNWAKLTRLEIRGPTAGQHWSYQTMIPFALRIQGFGLSAGNRLRILPSSNAECGATSENTWEALTAASSYQTMFNATILTQSSPVWAFEGYAESNSIVNIRDYYGQASEVVFRFDARGFGVVPTVKIGDIITLDNVTVNHSGTAHPASAEHEEMLTVPWGHRIQSQAQGDTTGTRFVIPLKLSHPDGSYPRWSASLQATWRRTSEAAFERLESWTSGSALKVCWSDGGTNSSDFATQAGTLDIEDAPLMAQSSASLVATTSGVVAPIVLAFRTSVSSSTQYRRIANSMMLRILLDDPRFAVRMADINATALQDTRAHNGLNREDQVVCGWLFKELWSSHVHGFPVPKGCWYLHRDRSYAIVFDPKNGLAGDTEYQIVMNVAQGEPPADPSYWERRPIARLFSMDDVLLRSEYAVEVSGAAK